MADASNDGPTNVTFGAGGVSIGGTPMVFDGETYNVSGDLHIRVQGRIYLECADLVVIQRGSTS